MVLVPRNRLPEYWIPEDLKKILHKNENFGTTENCEKYLSILKILKNVDRLELSECHYLQFLKLGLYLEEFESSVNLKMFNLYKKKISKVNNNSSNTFKINLEHIDKDSPLLKSCIKIIEVINPEDATKKFTLRVKEILDNHIIADAYTEFCISYNPNTFYDIRFRTNNYSFRCNHYAISLINYKKLTSYLFPKFSPNYSICSDKILISDSGLKWFDNKVSENPEQKQAVINIMNKSAYPAPYILYGPPGTGKTATLTEAVTQIWFNGKDNIIICAPSNAAADEITKRLLKHIPAKDIDRIYSRSRDSSLIDVELRKCSNYRAGRILKVNADFVSTKRILITTLITCSKLLFMNLYAEYSYVFIDEAGQSPEPDSLIAFNVISRHGSFKCQIILSGDPQQLGPCIKSKYAASILGQSILERLMKLELYEKINNNEYNSNYITKLVRNYRSHPAIIQVSNELYYDNELIACSSRKPFVNEDFKSEFPIIFHAVNGTEEKEQGNPSSYNSEEIKKVLEYVQLFIGEKVGDKEICASDIGIVTPFTLQSKNLRDKLKEQHLEDVTVGTVEIFQGQEKEIIIITTVRTKIFIHGEKRHIGFLSNPRRFNVALTRAKSNLVVVGDPRVLQIDYHWNYFLKFCIKNNACRGEKFEFVSDVDYLSTLIDSTDLNHQTCEQSIDLFSETFKILQIDDGIIREKKNKYLFNGSYYDERRCCIL